jgi:hypothetical protein
MLLRNRKAFLYMFLISYYVTPEVYEPFRLQRKAEHPLEKDKIIK